VEAPVISLLAGWLASRRLAPGGAGISTASLGLGLGLGLLSLTTYLWLVSGASHIAALLILEGSVLVGALQLPRTAQEAGETRAHLPRPRTLVAATALAAAGALLAALLTLQRFPFGAWDAVDIWNYRALVLTKAGLDAALGDVNHPDYPLLLPLVVSHAWRFVGESSSLPWLVGVACAAAAAGLLYGETSRRRGPAAAMMATSLLLATPFYAVHAASQRADVPLAFFALAATAVLVRCERAPRASLLLLAGALLGGAAWTKNEGGAFAVALLGAWLATATRRRLRELGYVLAGALPFALALLHHKLTCGATTDLIVGLGAGTLARVTDPSRWLLVGRAFASGAAFFLPAGVALDLALRWTASTRPASAHGEDLRFVWLGLALMLAIDFAVYLTTPLDPAWHLESSLDRVLLQLWPTALFALAIGAPAPWRPYAQTSLPAASTADGCGRSPQP
jgi:hypothetical protein